MESEPLTHVTFHRMRFPGPFGTQDRMLDAPSRAAHWMSGPSSALGADGLRARMSAIWCGLGFYTRREDAEAVLDAPDRTLAFLGETVEAWHALLCPITHRGEVNWFGELGAAARFRPSENDPGGLMAVITSAGFNPLPPPELARDMPRRQDFLANVDRVAAWFATLPGNLAREVYQPGKPGTDGMTFSLWASDEAMLAAGYRPGIHREQLHRYKTDHTADRTSFTRTRVLRSSGRWDGRALA